MYKMRRRIKGSKGLYIFITSIVLMVLFAMSSNNWMLLKANKNNVKTAHYAWDEESENNNNVINTYENDEIESYEPTQDSNVNYDEGRKLNRPLNPLADLIEDMKLIDGVVNIRYVITVKNQSPFNIPEEFRDFFEHFSPFFNVPKDQKIVGGGSGVIIDAKEGIVVTNYHVVKQLKTADEITITFNDRTETTAKIIGMDRATDIALLKLKKDKNHKIKALKFGDSDKVRVGEWVIAIGGPFGLNGTVTYGIVSGKARDTSRSNAYGANGDTGIYNEYIQTDAAVNQGNSGGALIDMNGNVIGIVNCMISNQGGGFIGVGFAIPSNNVRNIIDRLLKYGKVDRGWLGIMMQDITPEIAKSLSLSNNKGVIIMSVSDDSPAKRGGIVDGDVILSFNDQEIQSGSQFRRIVASIEIGKVIDTVVWRNGEKKTLKIKIDRNPNEINNDQDLTSQSTAIDNQNDAKEVFKGLYVASLSENIRANFGIDKNIKDGVIITKITKNSLAQNSELRVGDIIILAKQKHIRGPSDLIGQIQIAQKKKLPINLLIMRNKSLRYVTLNTNDDDAEE